MRNSRLCWDCRNENLCCTTPFKIWCLVKDSKVNRWELFLNLMPPKMFLDFDCRKCTHFANSLTKIISRICQFPPMPMRFISIYHWLHCHISSCINFLSGWYNMKKNFYFSAVCKVCWVSLTLLMSKMCREALFPSNSPHWLFSCSHKYSRVLQFTKKTGSLQFDCKTYFLGILLVLHFQIKLFISGRQYTSLPHCPSCLKKQRNSSPASFLRITHPR